MSDNAEPTAESGEHDAPDVLVSGRFALIPEWVMTAEITATAKLVFGIIALHGWKGASCNLRKKTIASLAGVGSTTVDRALRDLRDIGAVEIIPRWRQDPGEAAPAQISNGYRLLMHPPGTAGGVPPRPASGVPRKRTKTFREATPTSSEVVVAGEAPREEPEPPKMESVEGRNLPLDALAEETGVRQDSPRFIEAVTALNGTRANGGIDGIRAMAWRELHAAGFPRGGGPALEIELADLIRSRAAQYRAAMNGALLTPLALRKWWVDLPSMGSSTPLDAARVAADELDRMGG